VDAAGRALAVQRGYAGAAELRAFLARAAARGAALRRALAAASDPSDGAAALAVGDAYADLGLASAAVDAYRALAAQPLAAAPARAAACAELALDAARAGDVRGARGWLARGARLDPSPAASRAASAELARALLLAAERADAGAAAELRAWLTRHAGHVAAGEARFALGLACHASGADAEARAVLSSLLAAGDPRWSPRAGAQIDHISSPDHGHRH
jgi:hypothetical protein